ncbi:MAG: RDD family protein [Terriglobales bacterium]|jgi:uncharacterized RDD family membrane protein YckC
MSITPLPDLSPEAEGIHLAALDSYLGQPGSLPGVSFWPRVAACGIDLTVHYFIGFCGGFLVGIMLAIVAALQHTSVRVLLAHRTPGGIALFTFALLGSIVFEAICEGFHGSTPGKLLLSMVVVQEDGSPCRPGSAWVRSFAYIIDAFFFGLIGYFNMQKSPQQQRHGDEWAHTVVCRRSKVAPQNLRGIGQFTLALFFTALADAALIILGTVIKLTT